MGRRRHKAIEHERTVGGSLSARSLKGKEQKRYTACHTTVSLVSSRLLLESQLTEVQRSAACGRECSKVPCPGP